MYQNKTTCNKIVFEHVILYYKIELDNWILA